MSAHYLTYGLNGIGLAGGKLWGRVLEAGADMIFVLLLILIAKGYTGKNRPFFSHETGRTNELVRMIMIMIIDHGDRTNLAVGRIGKK